MVAELQQGSQEAIFNFMKSRASDFASAGALLNDLPAYAKKLDEKAVVLVSYTQDRQIDGMIAYYCNDYTLRIAHITYMAVTASSRGSKVSVELLDACLSDCKSRGMRSITLETWKGNERLLRWTEFRVSRWAKFYNYSIRKPRSIFGDPNAMEIYLDDC